jgi:hypothetical protein
MLAISSPAIPKFLSRPGLEPVRLSGREISCAIQLDGMDHFLPGAALSLAPLQVRREAHGAAHPFAALLAPLPHAAQTPSLTTPPTVPS